MGCTACQPQIRHSNLSVQLTDLLKKVTFFFIGFIILKFFFIPSTSLLFECLILLVLYAFIIQLSFLLGYWAILLTLFGLVTGILYLMQFIQNLIMGFAKKGEFLFLVLNIINLIFYYLLLKYNFLCYREYKALFFEQKGGNEASGFQLFGGGNDNNNIDSYNNNDYTYQRLNNDDNEHRGYIPFSGQGQTWG